MTETLITPRISEEAPRPLAVRPGWRRLLPKRLALSGAVALAIFAAAGYGHHWWTVGRFIESTDDAYVGGDVTVLAPRVAGLIAEVAVTDNQTVHVGDLLVKLDDRDYRAALARASGAVAAAEARLANLDANRDLQQALIAQATAEIAAADAQINETRADAQRYRKLVGVGATTVENVDRTDAAYKEALAAGDKAHAALDAAKRQLAVIDTEKQEAQAALAQAVAERDLAALDLQYTEIRAPLDGTIGNRSARVGAYATVGAQLLSIVPARGLWVDANFKESQLAEIRPGMAAEIQADVLPGRVFHGRVASLAPATGAEFSVLPPENATGNFTKIVQRVPIRILLEGDATELGALRPGLSVTASVDERGTASAL